MSRPSQSPVVLQSEKIDIGNTGSNVACLVVPSRCVVDKVHAVALSAQTSNAIIGFDVLSGSTQTANAAGVVTIPASSNAFVAYGDNSGRGQILYSGDKILIQVLDAGDSGEFFKASVLAIYEPENDTSDAVTDVET